MKRNDANTIIVTVTRTRTVVKDSGRQSQDSLVITETYGIVTTVVVVIRMANVIINEAVNLRTVLLLLIAKIVRNKIKSLLIVTLLAAMQSFAITVKEKIILMKVTTSGIPHSWDRVYFFGVSYFVIATSKPLSTLDDSRSCCYCNKQTAFNS